MLAPALEPMLVLVQAQVQGLASVHVLVGALQVAHWPESLLNSSIAQKLSKL